MRCRFCAEEIDGTSKVCPFCGEATGARFSLAETVSRLVPTKDQRLTALFLVAGVILALAPFLSGLSFTISPTAAQGTWEATVSSSYFGSVIALVLPLLGVAIVVAGVRKSAPGHRGAMRTTVFSAGVATAAVAVWSAASLFRSGQAGAEKFGDLSFTRAMHVEFGFLAPWIVLVVGLAVVAAVLAGLSRRVPAIIVLVVALAAGAAGGLFVGPLQSTDELLTRASAAVDGYEAQVAAEQAADRRQQQEAAQNAEDAAVGDCAGVVMGWVVAMAEGRADSNQVAFSIGTSNPVVQVIFSTYGTFYATAAREGVATALGVATNSAVDKCRDSRVREGAVLAPRASN